MTLASLTPPAEGEVHLWTIPLAASPEALERAASLLSGDEKARRDRFRFPVHRGRFALRRSALRSLLGGYLGIDPRQVRFAWSEHGKPALAAAGSRLRFNLSDSEDLAIAGFVLDHAVGVDVERVRPLSDMEAIARRHFSPGEVETLLGAREQDRLDCFFNAWTRKEAWLKARGDGLVGGLDTFDVTLCPGDPPRLLRVQGDPAAPTRWSLSAFSPRRGFTAAVAVERPEPFALVRLEWPPAASP
ncbi:MAG TPA: 4'-phosphopantetheinyl transferase superfamily protein [Candidatus Polarisedimenticolia bacterium]|nr:4'-phosphopantetheinyl transferase superfamily protein [Candidatus Polarisedimenticolia bacterium]